MLVHYTLNTGHTRQSRKSEVRADVTVQLRGLLTPGKHRLPDPFGDYTIVVPQCASGFVFTVYYGKTPIVTCGVADSEESEEEVWQDLERLYLSVTDTGRLAAADYQAPQKPDQLPWMAVVLLGPVIGYDWLGDFERCVAWTWLRRKR